MRLYGELASWYHLITHPSEYVEEAEHLLILRRAVGLAGARGMEIDRFATAADMDRGRACFVFRPGVAEHALRRRGSVRDFSTGPGPLAVHPPVGARP